MGEQKRKNLVESSKVEAHRRARSELASLAMMGLLASSGWSVGKWANLARKAYDIAEAMISEEAKRGG